MHCLPKCPYFFPMKTIFQSWGNRYFILSKNCTQITLFARSKVMQLLPKTIRNNACFTHKTMLRSDHIIITSFSLSLSLSEMMRRPWKRCTSPLSDQIIMIIIFIIIIWHEMKIIIWNHNDNDEADHGRGDLQTNIRSDYQDIYLNYYYLTWNDYHYLKW